MRVHLAVIAGLVAVGSAALAEPPKNTPASPVTPRKAPAKVVFASAESAPAPAPENAQQSEAPAKRRVARVTTCRCGDPQVDSDSQEQ